MSYDFETGTLFIQIPKTGCMAINQSRRSPYTSGEINHFVLAHWEKLLGKSPERVFAVWRDPIERFRSAYAFQSTKPKGFYSGVTGERVAPLLFEQREIALGGTVTDWIEWLLEDKSPRNRFGDNALYWPQKHFLEGEAKVELLRFEKLDEEYPRLVRELGLDRYRLPLHKINVTGHPKPILTARDEALLREIYAEDFEPQEFYYD